MYREGERGRELLSMDVLVALALKISYQPTPYLRFQRYFLAYYHTHTNTNSLSSEIAVYWVKAAAGKWLQLEKHHCNAIVEKNI